MSKKCKLSGSDLRKIDKMLRRGWSPGRTYGEVLAQKLPKKQALINANQVEVTNVRC